MPYGIVNADQIQSSVSGVSLGAGNASIMKNRIINGAMVIDQRNAGASVTPTAATYTLDRWDARLSVASKYAVQQVSTAGSPVGFSKALLVTSLSAYTVGAAENFGIQQVIEGYNIADLFWGTANAKPVTISAWVYSSQGGTFGGSLRNAAGNRSYPFTYTVTANTWTQISVTVAGDTSGTWETTNSGGIYLQFGLGAGSSFSGTAGTWASANYTNATGATSVVGTNGATFYITGVQLEVGSSATGFEYRQYGQELALCQRYYEKLSGAGTAGVFGSGAAGSTTDFRSYVRFSTPKRATPTISFSAANTFLYQGTSTTSPSAITSASANAFSSLVSATGTYTAGQAYTLLDNVSSSTYIAADSEL